MVPSNRESCAIQLRIRPAHPLTDHRLTAVTNRGRLSGPGKLSKPGSLSGPGGLPGNGSAGGPGSAGATALAAEPAEVFLAGDAVPAGERLSDYAERHSLEPASARPPALKYLRMLWQRRQFITGFATASNVAMYSEARLGQLWQVLTPLLNAAVYFLIFGVLLHISRGVPDYITFLVTGIYVVIELQQLLLSFCVLFVIILAYGEPFTWYWFLILPVLALQTLFNVGCAFILARWGSGFDDVSQLLPFVIRTWMYASGVIFSITTSLALVPGQSLYFHKHLAYLLQINPAAVYITLIRNSLLTSQRISMPGYHPFDAVKCAMYGNPAKFHIPSDVFANKVIYYSSYCKPIVTQQALWGYAVGWAVVAAVAGFFFFWWAETRYGRG